METAKKKNGFASGIGFILAAAGSAVGLGNLWGFPYKTAAYGGAAFVIVYIMCVIFIGIVAMIAEIYLGRRSQANTITAFKKVDKNMGWSSDLTPQAACLITLNCISSVVEPTSHPASSAQAAGAGVPGVP